jgi:hypothetical protein
VKQRRSQWSGYTTVLIIWADSILVRTDLSPRLIEVGRELITALGAHGAGFEAAFWLMDEENGRWHLVLSSRSVKMDGSRAQYAEVDNVLATLPRQSDIWIGMISVVGHQTPLVKSLRKALGTAANIDGVRLDNAFIDGVLIPGCMVYRLSRRQKLQPTTSEVRK